MKSVKMYKYEPVGMDVFDEKVMLGYSTMDRETHYMNIGKSWFEENKVM